MERSGTSVSHPYHVLPSTWRAAVEQLIREFERTNSLIVIRGEPGTGKDWLARLIHAASARRSGPFIKINCAASADRLAIELFGHERDAWPGASRRRLGMVEFAHRGTLFLDEIGELPPALHPDLLHVIQDGQSTRLGGRDSIPVDLQVVAATRQPLNAVYTGRRLYETPHLLRILDVEVPPLRDRQDEIPALAVAFLARFNAEYQHSTELSAEWLALFAEYPWPGNIRELATVVRRLVVSEDPAAVRAELQTAVRFWASSAAQSA
jgi:DNA-binding NtrC family response regulator